MGLNGGAGPEECSEVGSENLLSATEKPLPLSGALSTSGSPFSCFLLSLFPLFVAAPSATKEAPTVT